MPPTGIRSVDGVGYLDADEFFEPLGSNVFDGAALVRSVLRQSGVHACGFRWAVFGSKSDELDVTKSVLGRFSYRGACDHQHSATIKSFARTSALLRCLFRKGWPKFDAVMRKPHKFMVAERRYIVDDSRGTKEKAHSALRERTFTKMQAKPSMHSCERVRSFNSVVAS